MKPGMIIAAAALLVSAVLAFGCGGNNPSAVVDKFMQAQKDKDCEKQAELIDVQAPELGGAVTRESLVKNCQETADEVEVIDYKVLEEEIDGDTARVKAEVTLKIGEDEQTQTGTITLHKRGDSWKIGPTGL